MIFNSNRETRREDLNINGKVESTMDSGVADAPENAPNRHKPRRRNEAGFSLIELIIVLTLLLTVAGISFYYLANHRVSYRSDNQALQAIDLMQTARQYALNKRRTMRVEFNLTTRLGRLIDENTTTTANDDTLIKTIAIPPDFELRCDRRPANIASGPSEVTPTPDAVFANSVYGAPNPIGSTGQNVFTLRFLRNGTVMNAGSDAIGTNAVNTGATLYFYVPASPTDTTNTGASTSRAITVLSTGSMRLWYQIPPVNVVGGVYWSITH